MEEKRVKSICENCRKVDVCKNAMAMANLTHKIEDAIEENDFVSSVVIRCRHNLVTSIKDEPTPRKRLSFYEC